MANDAIRELACDWWLKSFRVGGVEAAEQPLDFSTGPRVVRDVEAMLARAARITGRVTSVPTSRRALVVAFATEPEQWFPGSNRIRTAYSSPEGYALNVPPGRYHVVAIDGLDVLRAVDAAIFRRLQRVATTVVVPEGGAVIDLQATAPP